MTTTSATATTATTWLSTTERGTLLGIRLMYWLVTALGRGPARVLVRIIALWYAAFGGSTTRASRAWLQTVFGTPATFGMVYKHQLYFAQATVDRIFLLKGKISAFEVTTTGKHHLLDAVAKKQGAILLGAHHGSFEAMRADGDRIELPLNILGHFANAKMINALFDQLNPDLAARVIQITESVDFIFEVQERVLAGEFVGTMGDRVGLNEKSVEVTFFGRPTRFPTGPFVLASVLKCPVFLTFGLYREPNGYDLFCEPFIEKLTLPRRGRDKELQEIVQRYAQRLEDYARRSPYNWFNFYDFWDSR